MKKGIKKAISTIAILTMTFQIGMPMIPGVQTTVLATDTINSVEENLEENIQSTADKVGTTELSESTDTTLTEEISRNYEIKEEETWDVSANGDGSVIAKWTLEDKTLTISGTGEMKDWSLDSKEDWHDTQYTNAIENVIIEEELTNIGSYAFSSCSSLKNINMPKGIIYIGPFAFYHCSSIKSIEIPETVRTINQATFNRCTSLENIMIPQSITSIEREAFAGCSKLKNVIIPESVKEIGEQAFFGCENLNNITIPEKVKSIGNYALYGCDSLISIDVDANNEIYISEDGILFNKEKTEIIKYPSAKSNIKEYVIPSTVISIREYAFQQCDNLEYIEIPEQITSIGIGAFYECTKLKNINIPSGITIIENSTFYRCTDLESIEISNNITSIGKNAFYECVNLENINIPESVTSIGERAFGEDNSLVLFAKADSIAHQYAEENEIGYVLDGDALNVDTNYEIKEEKTWNVSKEEDGNVIARWTFEDRTLIISGTGEMKDWDTVSAEDWHNTQYTKIIENVVIEDGITRDRK